MRRWKKKYVGRVFEEVGLLGISETKMRREGDVSFGVVRLIE